uniref:C2H2-type domain-containing protein n=1 Tax=Opuntia streptacantha TaxID=393608 RepID=A0A7C9AV38_OPUST
MYLGTLKTLKKLGLLNEMHIRRPKTLMPFWRLDAFSQFGHFVSFYSSNWPSSMVRNPQSTVGIFWDLENKPPNSVSPFEAGIRLKRAVSSFGVVRYMVAYANRHAFSYVPPGVKERRMERKVLNHMENKGIIKPVEPYLCRVCGRKFNTNEKLINHFKIHEQEHQKRLNQIESAKGKKRVNLVGKYAMKMEKYENAARDILTPKVGYGLAEDLKRAGFWVKTVSDNPQAADVALRNHMVHLMDHRRIQCMVLVSDDSDFVRVLQEGRERCVKTVVVGDNVDGVLKRNADASFSWKEILIGKAKKEAVSVVSRWKDCDILKRLEWSYNAEGKRDGCDRSDDSDFEDFQVEDEKLEHSIGQDDIPLQMKDDRPWWELDSDAAGASSNHRTRL